MVDPFTVGVLELLRRLGFAADPLILDALLATDETLVVEPVLDRLRFDGVETVVGFVAVAVERTPRIDVRTDAPLWNDPESRLMTPPDSLTDERTAVLRRKVVPEADEAVSVLLLELERGLLLELLVVLLAEVGLI